MEFYSDIHLNNKTVKQTDKDGTDTVFEADLKHMLPLAGGVDITKLGDDYISSGVTNRTVYLNSFKEPGRYYVKWINTDDNGYGTVTSLTNNSTTASIVNNTAGIAFELIVNDITGPLPNDTSNTTASYKKQTIHYIVDSTNPNAVNTIFRYIFITGSGSTLNTNYSNWEKIFTPSLDADNNTLLGSVTNINSDDITKNQDGSSIKETAINGITIGTETTLEGQTVKFINNVDVFYASKIVNATSFYTTGYQGNTELLGSNGILADIDKRLSNLGFNTGVVEYVFINTEGNPVGNWQTCGIAIKNGNIYTGFVSNVKQAAGYMDSWILRIRFKFNGQVQKFKWGIGQCPSFFIENGNNHELDLHNLYQGFMKITTEFETIGWSMSNYQLWNEGTVNAQRQMLSLIFVCGTGPMPDIFNS